MAEGGGGGGGGGGGYSRAPKYQNKFAFKHNPHSRLTLKIGAIPATAGCCARCAAQIEWKRTYRKYRALTKPRKCTGCSLPKVKLAYHVLCAACAEARGRVCPKCLKSRAEADLERQRATELEKEIAELQAVKGQIPGVPERERRSTLRKMIRELARLRGDGDEDGAGEAKDGEGEGEGEDEADGGGDGEAGGAAGAGGGAAAPAPAPKAKAPFMSLAQLMRKKAAQKLAAQEDEDGEGEDEDEDEEDEDEDEEEEDEEDEDDEEEDDEVEAAAAAPSAATAVAAAASASAPLRDADGLVDPSIFSRALAEAERRKGQMRGERHAGGGGGAK